MDHLGQDQSALIDVMDDHPLEPIGLMPPRLPCDRALRIGKSRLPTRPDAAVAEIDVLGVVLAVEAPGG
jgi:hypothetical protein